MPRLDPDVSCRFGGDGGGATPVGLPKSSHHAKSESSHSASERSTATNREGLGGFARTRNVVPGALYS